MGISAKIRKALEAKKKQPKPNNGKKSKVKKRKKKPTILEQLGKKYSKQLKHRATPSERRFATKLRAFDFTSLFQYPISNKETLYIIDFFIPKYNVVIEIDGGYHLDHRQKEKDDIRDKRLNDLGYKVWRLTNIEADEITPDEILGGLLSKSR